MSRLTVRDGVKKLSMRTSLLKSLESTSQPTYEEFRFFLHALPSLEELSLNSPFYLSDIDELTPKIRYMLPFKSFRRILLEGNVIFPEDNSKSIAELCPNLESLRLSINPSTAMLANLLGVFPTTLTSLHVGYSNKPWNWSAIPTSLTKLSISLIPFEEGSSSTYCSAYTCLSLLERLCNLRSLHVRLREGLMLQAPFGAPLAFPLLEEFLWEELGSTNGTTTFPTSFITAPLLSSLGLTKPAGHFMWQPASLPPTLTMLALATNGRAFGRSDPLTLMAVCMNFLPSGLKSLHMIGNVQIEASADIPWLEHLPVGLKSLIIPPTAIDWTKLPPRLERLICNPNSFAAVEDPFAWQVPYEIVSTSFAMGSPLPGLNLPPTLTELHLTPSIIVPDQMSILPPFIRKLTLRNSPEWTISQAKTLLELRPSLEWLHFACSLPLANPPEDGRTKFELVSYLKEVVDTLLTPQEQRRMNFRWTLPDSPTRLLLPHSLTELELNAPSFMQRINRFGLTFEETDIPATLTSNLCNLHGLRSLIVTTGRGQLNIRDEIANMQSLEVLKVSIPIARFPFDILSRSLRELDVKLIHHLQTAQVFYGTASSATPSASAFGSLTAVPAAAPGVFSGPQFNTISPASTPAFSTGFGTTSTFGATPAGSAHPSSGFAAGPVPTGFSGSTTLGSTSGSTFGGLPAAKPAAAPTGFSGGPTTFGSTSSGFTFGGLPATFGSTSSGSTFGTSPSAGPVAAATGFAGPSFGVTAAGSAKTSSGLAVPVAAATGPFFGVTAASSAKTTSGLAVGSPGFPAGPATFGSSSTGPHFPNLSGTYGPPKPSGSTSQPSTLYGFGGPSTDAFGAIPPMPSSTPDAGSNSPSLLPPSLTIAKIDGIRYSPSEALKFPPALQELAICADGSWTDVDVHRLSVQMPEAKKLAVSGSVIISGNLDAEILNTCDAGTIATLQEDYESVSIDSYKKRIERLLKPITGFKLQIGSSSFKEFPKSLTKMEFFDIKAYQESTTPSEGHERLFESPPTSWPPNLNYLAIELGNLAIELDQDYLRNIEHIGETQHLLTLPSRLVTLIASVKSVPHGNEQFEALPRTLKYLWMAPKNSSREIETFFCPSSQVLSTLPRNLEALHLPFFSFEPADMHTLPPGLQKMCFRGGDNWTDLALALVAQVCSESYRSSPSAVFTDPGLSIFLTKPKATRNDVFLNAHAAPLWSTLATSTGHAEPNFVVTTIASFTGQGLVAFERHSGLEMLEETSRTLFQSGAYTLHWNTLELDYCFPDHEKIANLDLVNMEESEHGPRHSFFFSYLSQITQLPSMSSLKCLSVYAVRDYELKRIFQHLPQCLEHLLIATAKVLACRESDWAYLPRGLKTLSINCAVASFQSPTQLIGLPPNLEALHLDFSIFPIAFPYLPATLQYLWTPSRAQDIGDVWHRRGISKTPDTARLERRVRTTADLPWWPKF